MAYPDLRLIPAAYPSVERVAAAAFQICSTSCEVLCLGRRSVWGLEPGMLDKRTCTMTRESPFQCYEWPTSQLQEDWVFQVVCFISVLQFQTAMFLKALYSMFVMGSTEQMELRDKKRKDMLRHIFLSSTV